MKALYVGTNPSHVTTKKTVIHFPVIQTVLLDIHSMEHIWSDFLEYTHILFTSKNSVPFFLQAVSRFSLESYVSQKKILAIGHITADHLSQAGMVPAHIACPETQEGVGSLIRQLDRDIYLFYPRAKQARSYLETFLAQMEIRHQICHLYETVAYPHQAVPSLDEFDEIIFTSPSTIKYFIHFFSKIPKDKRITCLGPVTQEAINKYFTL